MLHFNLETRATNVRRVLITDLIKQFDIPFPKKIVIEYLASWGIVVNPEDDFLYEFDIESGQMKEIHILYNVKEAMTTMRKR